MLILCGILNILAILFALIGLFASGTGSVTLIGIACLLAIFARMCQASHQHDQILAAIRGDALQKVA